MPKRPIKEQKNPFSPAFPINPKFFLNRVEILESFRRAIQRSSGRSFAPTPDNIVVLGEWGIGKTSVLRKFESILMDEIEADSNKFSATIEITQKSAKKPTSLIAKILDDISRNFSISEIDKFRIIRDEIREWKSLSNGSEQSLKKKIGNGSPTVYLKDVLVNLWELIEKKAEADIAVLMIDNLHNLLGNGEENLDDLSWIFNSLQKHGCNFVLCATSQKDPFFDATSTNDTYSRFFNLTHNISSFGLKETKSAILKPLKLTESNVSISDESIEKVHLKSAGHPYFIQFIMRELMSTTENKITLDSFENNYSRIFKLLENEKFDRDIFSASDKERKILAQMANLSEKFSPSEIKIKDSRTQLRFLMRKNLIKKYDRGEYSLYHPLFKEYLQKKQNKR